MTDVTDLTRRLERLETQNRRMTLAGVVVVVAIVTAALMGQGAPQSQTAQDVVKARVVEAEVLALRGEDGKLLGSWGALSDGSIGLYLYDKDGKIRGSWGVLADGSIGLSLRDKDGKSRSFWAVLSDGSTGLNLRDKDEHIRAVLGSTQLETGTTGATQMSAESSLVLFDEAGKVIFRAP